MLAPAGRLAGDANDDGVISADDYTNVQSNCGNTAGLSGYSIWTRGVNPSQVSYEEGTLDAIGDDFSTRGFQASTFMSGDVGGFRYPSPRTTR